MAIARRDPAALIVVALVMLSCGPSFNARSSWTADTGIYGTYEHFGPPSFICGVGYDLRYRGSPPLEALSVTVRHPAGSVLAGQGTSTDGWVTPANPISINDHDVAKMAALSGHVGGSAGGVCPNGPADLASLRGTIVRVSWREHGAAQREDIVVDRVRTLVRMWGGTYETDWQTRIEWAP